MRRTLFTLTSIFTPKKKGINLKSPHPGVRKIFKYLLYKKKDKARPNIYGHFDVRCKIYTFFRCTNSIALQK